MKLSPYSVPYRILERGASIVVTAVILLSGASSVAGGLGLGVVLLLLSGAVLLLVAYEVAYYRRFEYELTADTFDIRSGVLSRRNREIPLRRIQNVDISRNVVQRALGIAAVDFETAGGSETEASLRFVSFEEAQRLQRDLSRRKRGVEDGDDDAAAETGTTLFALSTRELALVGALSFDVRLPGAVFLLVSSLLPVLSSFAPASSSTALFAGGLAVLFVVVVLVAWAAGAAAAVLNYYGFRLRRVGDELQYERGLLRRYDGSIPLDKVQTLTVVDDPLKRAFGYASLRIETAGYAPGGGGGEGSEAAVPLATRERVFALARDIEPMGTPSFERPPKRVRRRYALRYLLGLGVVVGAFYGAATVASLPVTWYAPALLALFVPVMAHLKWKHRGYWLGEDHLVTRNGVLRRRTKVVPYYRVQTVIDSRTLFQRRWNVATVTADTAGSLSLGGGNAAAAVDVDEETADALRRTLGERLRAALAARRGWTDSRSDDDDSDGGGAVSDEAVAGDDTRGGEDDTRSGEDVTRGGEDASDEEDDPDPNSVEPPEHPDPTSVEPPDDRE